MEKNEEWRPVKGYEGYYEASDMGNVKSVDRYIVNHGLLGGAKTIKVKGRLLKQHLTRDGYLYVCLSIGGVNKRVRVHRIIVDAFIPEDNSRQLIDHINTIKTDNRLSNLRRCTASENAQNPITRQHYREYIERNGTDMYKHEMPIEERLRRKTAYSGSGNPMYGKTHNESAKEKMRYRAKVRIPKNYKMVAQYTLEGELIRIWDGVIFAARGTGINKSSIAGCCRNIGKTAGGFLWQYIKKNDNRDRSATQEAQARAARG